MGLALMFGELHCGRVQINSRVGAWVWEGGTCNKRERGTYIFIFIQSRKSIGDRNTARQKVAADVGSDNFYDHRYIYINCDHASYGQNRGQPGHQKR
jgi:hypothetical protein